MIINNTVHTQDSINISSASFLLKVKKKRKKKKKRREAKWDMRYPCNPCENDINTHVREAKLHENTELK